MERLREFMAGTDDAGRRLDRVIRRLLPGLPLSAIHRALRRGKIRLNGVKAEPGSRVESGDTLLVFPELTDLGDRNDRMPPPPESGIFPDVLIETQDLLFVNKPLGRLVHDGPDSLEAMVRRRLSLGLPPSLSFRPGPLHRLDRNTSGVLAFSKTLRGARLFAEAQRKGELSKTYLALLSGALVDTQTWEDRLDRDEGKKKTIVMEFGETPGLDGGKAALSHVRPLAAADSQTLALIRIDTGRTHQIRAQAAAHGHPLVGDVKYGGEARSLPYYLHAISLDLADEAEFGLHGPIIAPLPNYFLSLLSEVFHMTEKDIYSYLKPVLP